MSLLKAKKSVVRITSLLYNLPEVAQYYAAVPTSVPGTLALMQTTRDSFVNALKHSRNKAGGSHNHCVFSWDGTALILHAVC